MKKLACLIVLMLPTGASAQNADTKAILAALTALEVRLGRLEAKVNAIAAAPPTAPALPVPHVHLHYGPGAPNPHTVNFNFNRPSSSSIGGPVPLDPSWQGVPWFDDAEAARYGYRRGEAPVYGARTYRTGMSTTRAVRRVQRTAPPRGRAPTSSARPAARSSSVPSC